MTELWYQIQIEAMCVRGATSSNVMRGDQKKMVLKATAKKLVELAAEVDKLGDREWPDADWRVGLSVKPKYRNDVLFGKVLTCVAAAPSGEHGIDDPDGVLFVQELNGRGFWSPADRWVTA